MQKLIKSAITYSASLPALDLLEKHLSENQFSELNTLDYSGSGFIYAALVSPIAIAVPLVTAVLFIIVAIALNGRDRENDGQFLLKILEKITGSKK